MKLDERVCVVTGGTGVIGRAIVASFKDEGARVVAVGHQAEHVADVKRDLGVDGFVADVASETDVTAMMKHIEETYGRIDVLVTAAGTYGEIGTILQCEPDAWMQAIRVNLLGTMMILKYAIPLLQKSAHGRVIAFAGGGDGPLPRFTSYAASKGAVIRFVESVAEELRPLGIAINAISPGLVNSGFVKEILRVGEERAGKEKFQDAQAQVAGTGGSVPPDRAGALAVFLASGASGDLTGKNLSAIWDRWETFPGHLEDMMRSDVYNWRRIKPKDRGYDW
jgi:3-oxoacyl-[acyl-carrier protein] reductase